MGVVGRGHCLRLRTPADAQPFVSDLLRLLLQCILLETVSSAVGARCLALWEALATGLPPARLQAV